jgi:basic membrane lipoprotein Med (substrate-binding protein (PBP1-ABC) superfamily)
MSTSFSGKHTTIKKVFFLVSMLAAVFAFASCAKKEPAAEAPAQESQQSQAVKSQHPYSIAVFVPGIISGSATYEMLVQGAEKAAAEHNNTAIQVIEGGSNQGEWEEKVSALAAGSDYDVIVTSNPAMPAICDAVSKRFPQQQFIIMDGFFEGNENMYTLRYNQYQQALLAGHMAGLVTTSSMPGANSKLAIGLIAGQEYPDMNELILPGFQEGAKLVNEAITVDFRVVGNWYDAAKGAELARSMINGGADVILAIAGGANQGVLTAAGEKGVYVHWYDSNGYANKPGTVIGSTAILQDKAVYQTVTKAIEGSLEFGKAETFGIKEGYITFIEDDDNYRSSVPEELRAKQHQFTSELIPE